VEGGLLLNVVVGECAAVLQLLASEDEALLVGGNTLLVLDFSLHGLDCVGALDFEGDGLSCESLDEDLHSSTEAKYQVKGRLFLNIVVR
jgi:hypothetical protein